MLLALMLIVGPIVVPYGGSRRTALRSLQPVVSIRASQGYWLVAADGGVFSFGDARYLGPNRNQGNDIIGMTRTPDGNGLWTVDDDGDVFHTGSAINYGSRLVDTNDIRGFAARPQGDGYWMVTKNGAVFSYGRAAFHGPFVPLNLSKLVVGMAATASGAGYWFVARDGGIFSYGDAQFYGSTGAIALNQPIVGMAATPSGKGYWLVASDGGIFSFGDAAFHGSTGGMALNQPIVGMAPTGTGNGYWLVASDGGIFSFGDAAFHGSTGGMALHQPIVGLVPTRGIRSNDFPTAVPDSVTLNEDTPVTVSVLDNDSGLTDAPITVSVLEGPSHGTASVDSGGRITYTPAPNYFGPDALTYVVADADGDQSMATLNITVSSLNDPPLAADQALFTSEETPINGFLAASDADGDAITYAVTTPPAHGVATVNGAAFFTYTPAADYNGNDTFVITASDGRGGSDTVNIGISVGILNDPPVAGDQSVSTEEETPVSGSIVATDPEGDTFTYSVGTAPAHGSASVDAAGTFTYTPALDYVGPDSFVITVDDGHGGTDGATINVTVTGLNDPPTIDAIPPASGIEDQPVTVNVTVGDAETLPESLVVTATSSNQAVVLNSGISYGGSGASRSVTLTPVANAFGSTTITVTISDGVATASQSFVLTLTAVNDPPTITAIADQSAAEDTPVTVGFTVADIESLAGSLVVSATSSNEGVVANTGISYGGLGGSRSVTLQPVADASGSTIITVTVSDGIASASRSFILTVNANTAPTITAIADASTNEDSPLTVNFTVADAEASAGSLVVNATSSNQAVVLNGGISYGGSGASRSVTLTPVANAFGSTTITVTVSDGSLTASESFTLTVNAVPVAGNQSLEVNLGGVLPGSVMATDADGDTLSYSVITDAVQGDVNVDASGNFTYTPDAAYVGSDSFTIMVSDGRGGTGTATIDVLVVSP